MEIKTLSEINLGTIDLVLLDLDNTLYEYKRCHEQAMATLVQKICKQFNVTTDHVTKLYLEGRTEVHTRHRSTAASHSRFFYIQSIIEKLSNATNTELISSLYDIYWNTFIDTMDLYPDGIEFLENCLQKKIPVILVTDMIADIQFKKLNKLRIGKYFHFIVTSEEAGVEKPNPFIFEIAIDKASRLVKEIETIAVVGDDIKKDLFLSENYLISIFHLLRHD